jgi:chemotaxis regulatin CheY-phosphate phosphatase CheZ
MAEPRQAEGTPGGVRGAQEAFITIPSRARDEIGELAFYIEKVRQSLHEVNEHARGSSQTMPGVLHNLQDVLRMTESATIKVLEETEALMEEGQTAGKLLGEARQAVEARALGEVGATLERAQALVATGGVRALTIMAALEFQDLTAQKVARAFEVVEEVGARLLRIQALVDLDQATGRVQDSAAAARAAANDIRPDSKAGQALADEILMQFNG